ncbi:sugar ABC transporter substrate-binding protein [Microbispora triticiradicis]|uniref:sugar ABC transporter substrate-binding protein n=1 Tax=Microbispora triticiradicis TaxID=2200763 RepID=UPI001FCDABD7|nr:sugar ABC transporter substrate-binding protein [Microbispora triticiradicis]
MRRRRFGAGLILAMSGFLAAACGGNGGSGGEGSAASGGTDTAAKAVVGVDYPRSDTDFWNSYIQYVPKFAGELGVDLKTTNSQNDVAKLAANVQTQIGQGVKAVVMAPQDTAAVAPTLQQLEGKKIPAVLVDTRPDTGNAFMVVRADNRAYGEKACKFLGEKLQGKGKVVMLEGDLASINGRDRTEAFNDCMKQNYPGITVFGEATKWDGAVAAQKLSTRLTANPDIKGVYMQSSFALAGTLQVLKQRNILVPPDDPKHVFVVSNDGIPQELKDIASGNIDATVSQPADLYAKWALSYAQAAAAGKTFQPGKTDHDSTIIEVRPGLLEDQLSAPLVTADGGTYGDIPSVKHDDKSLWGNNLS